MKEISLFVYDFDGTLVDTLHDIADAVNRTLAELNQRELSRELIRNFVGRGVNVLLTRALEGCGYDDIPHAVELFRKHYAAHLMDHTVFYPNGPEVLKHFSHKKNAILSNKPEDFVRKILVELDHIDSFHSILGGDSLSAQKPDPAGLNQIMQMFGIESNEVVMIGDSALDIETGKRASVQTCGVTFGLGDPEELKSAEPDWMIDDLSELKRLFR